MASLNVTVLYNGNKIIKRAGQKIKFLQKVAIKFKIYLMLKG